MTTQQPITVSPDQELTQDTALSILIQGVRVAQSKGVYNIEEAELLSKCVRRFIKPQEQTDELTTNDDTITDDDNTNTVTI